MSVRWHLTKIVLKFLLKFLLKMVIAEISQTNMKHHHQLLKGLIQLQTVISNRNPEISKF